MRLIAFGINHKTAPVAIREQAAFAPEQLPQALREITAQAGVDEATILSTCNRTEVYCRLDADDGHKAVKWFCDFHHLPANDIQPHLYLFPDQEAVKHAFRVAAGLDSMVLGEPQILGQMKTAFTLAHKTGATGKILNRLFQQTFSVAKQVRTDTAIGASAVSVAYAAVSLARKIFQNLAEKQVLLIGAGETIELVARHLREQGVTRILVANRTSERASCWPTPAAARRSRWRKCRAPGRGRHGDHLDRQPAADPRQGCRGKRAQGTSPPANVHGGSGGAARHRTEVGGLADVYSIPSMTCRRPSRRTSSRARKRPRKREDHRHQVVDFMHWVRSLDSVPAIRALRESTTAVCEAELKRAQRRLARGDDPQKVMQQLARALTNKFTHAPSDALKKAGHDGDAQLLDAARRLFGLGDDL